MSRLDSMERNRDRITRAAETIIRSDGVAKLTMRRLAREAGVALKTPYNLFESKAGVLIALLSTAIESLIEDLGPDDKGGAIADLAESLEEIREFFSTG